MTQILEQSAVYAAIIVTITEAIRSKFPFLDGWRVLAVAGAAAVVLCVLFMAEPTTASLLDTARVTFLSWVMAVGGNAWASKLAGKAGGA